MPEPRICNICGANATTTAIAGGKFGTYCKTCLSKGARTQQAHQAIYNRDREREDYAKDLIQPWVNGKPNKEFITNYPEYAKENFTEEELREYG